MMIDLGDGWHARCAALELELDVLRARDDSRRGDLASLYRENDRLRASVLAERAAVHRRLLDAFQIEGVHADLVSRIMLRLIAVPVTSGQVVDTVGGVPAQRAAHDVATERAG